MKCNGIQFSRPDPFSPKGITFSRHDPNRRPRNPWFLFSPNSSFLIPNSSLARQRLSLSSLCASPRSLRESSLPPTLCLCASVPSQSRRSPNGRRRMCHLAPARSNSSLAPQAPHIRAHPCNPRFLILLLLCLSTGSAAHLLSITITIKIKITISLCVLCALCG